MKNIYNQNQLKPVKTPETNNEERGLGECETHRVN